MTYRLLIKQMTALRMPMILQARQISQICKLLQHPHRAYLSQRALTRTRSACTKILRGRFSLRKMWTIILFNKGSSNQIMTNRTS